MNIQLQSGSRPAPKFAHVGKQRRYSFIQGRERKWHACIPLDAQAAKSLRGMVAP